MADRVTNLDILKPDLEPLPGTNILRPFTGSSFFLEPVDCYLTLNRSEELGIVWVFR
jgi:hypothetical protein